MTPSVILLIIYLIITIAIGIYHRYRIGVMTVSHFTSNNRDTSYVVLTATTFATYAGGGLVFGYIELGYRVGVGAIYVAMCFLIGILLAAAIAPKIREIGGNDKNWYEFTDFIVGQIGPRLRKPSAIVNIIIFFAIMAAQLVAMGRIIELMTDLPYIYSLIIISLVVYLYTSYAGLGGVYWTDMFQGSVIILVTGLILAPFAFSSTSLELIRALPEGMITGETAGLTLIIGALVFIAPSVLVRSDTWQRILSSRSPKIARHAFLTTAIVIAPMYIIFPMLGMIAHAQLGIVPDTNIVPFVFLSGAFGDQPWIFALLLVALFAVLMTSCDSFLHLVGLIFSRLRNNNLWEQYHNPNQNNDPKNIEKKVLFSLRITMGGLIVGGLLIAVFIPRIVDLMIVALSIVLIFLPATAHSLIKGEGNELAALFSIYSGLIVFIIAFLIAILDIWGRTEEAFVYSVIISFLFYFGVLIYERLYPRERPV